jgi:hypothetical protein
MKKLVMFSLVIVAGMFSCSDNEPVNPTKEKVSPPPVSINVTGRLQSSAFPETAEVWYMITTSPSPGTWTYLATISATNCLSLGSISANNGDLLHIVVVESGNYDGVVFKAKTGAGCPGKTTPDYCGNLIDNGGYTHTVSGGTDIAIQATVSNGHLYNCYF